MSRVSFIVLGLIVNFIISPVNFIVLGLIEYVQLAL